MEDAVESQEYKVSEYEDLIGDIEKRDGTLSITDKDNEDKKTFKINFTEGGLSTYIEGSDKHLGNFFGKKDVIINEKWDFTENVQGKVIHLNEEEVFVDCLIDVVNKTFQQRAFPIYLFKNIDGLASNKTVIIKTRMKTGSVRIDLYPGEGIVRLDLFKQKENWENLAGSGLDDKLTKW